MITFITQANLKYLQEPATILGPQNHTHGHCGVSGQWTVSTIGRNNTDPESINRDTTNTHWPLNITNIHSLAILWQKCTIILWHNITFQLEQMPNI